MNRKQRRASIAYGRKLMRQGWTPFQEVSPTEARVKGVDFGSIGAVRVFANSTYVVQEFRHRASLTPDSPVMDITRLLVRRNDGGAVRSWGDLQRIKSEIAGPTRVAFEVFPSDADVVDQANCYHLWVMPSPFILPFGLHLDQRGEGRMTGRKTTDPLHPSRTPSP